MQKIENNAGAELKDNKIKVTKLENVLKMKEKEFVRLQDKLKNLEDTEKQLREIKQVFESVNFEKAWGGLKLSVSDLEKLTKTIKG